MGKCPYCAEEIQDAAVKCRYCREWLKKGELHTAIADALRLGGKQMLCDIIKWTIIIIIAAIVFTIAYKIAITPISTPERRRIRYSKFGDALSTPLSLKSFSFCHRALNVRESPTTRTGSDGSYLFAAGNIER